MSDIPPAAPPAAPTPPAPPAPAAPPAPPAAPPATVDKTTRLPDDHPLVTAYARTKAELVATKEKTVPDQPAGGDLATVTARAEKAEMALLRIQVADAKGLTPGQAVFLGDGSKEELEAKADAILTAFPAAPAAPAAPPSNQPTKTPPRGGGDPTQDDDVIDPAKLADAIPRP